MQLAFDLFDDALEITEVPSKSLKPYEMTLAAFLASPDWVAYPDPRATGESKGMYCLRQPDGSKWPGGWIGKFKDEKSAKIQFHRDQVFYTILWGRDDIDPKVLFQYPHFKKAQEAVHQYLSWIEFDLRGDYIRVNLPSVSRWFHILDFPLYSRVSTRGFVKDHGLNEFEMDLTKTDSMFNQVEVASIALMRFLSKFIDESHRPHFLIPNYDHLTSGIEGIEVEFRIPIDLADGKPHFKKHVGRTVHCFFGDTPRIEYEEDGERKYWNLYPSQLLAIKEDGHWKDCSLTIR